VQQLRTLTANRFPLRKHRIEQKEQKAGPRVVLMNQNMALRERTVIVREQKVGLKEQMMRGLNEQRKGLRKHRVWLRELKMALKKQREALRKKDGLKGQRLWMLRVVQGQRLWLLRVAQGQMLWLLRVVLREQQGVQHLYEQSKWLRRRYRLSLPRWKAWPEYDAERHAAGGFWCPWP
jgi:hypothetical protein